MLAELAAAEIAKIAFEAVIGKLTEGAMDKGVELWQKIKQKLQKEPTAAQVLAAAEQTKSEAMIEQQVVPFLQVEMLKDPNFAQEIQTLAQQIKQVINSGNQENIDMNATAYDNSTVKMVGKIEAGKVSF
ncbi:hypothetical protein IQ223_17730 [Microcystis aeruginosa LEGE 00239]|jgi:hypothetical protein|uniref:hypothetical protein n=1 Tax=Microcystis aeruginosa TaxID=1126 RepID=UPI0018800C55|nr:hypothetical protein [Microcystis aeruginosa]MBE9246275.1 hypothetical protein [Microcystis aeruginosa LEGE 00239]